jgi:3-deoxy-D-manno-octulosonic-acid transferase
MGEVLLFYASSDIAFVGGSLVPIGGHNMLEPAVQGLPIISGPHLFNAQDIADKMVELGACRIVSDSDELADVVAGFIDDPAEAERAGNNGMMALEQNRGSLERLLVLLEPLLGRVAAD